MLSDIMKLVYLYVTTIFVISASVPKDVCEPCLPTHECKLLGNLDKENQQNWIEKLSCLIPHKDDNRVPPGFFSIGICCSNNIENHAQLQSSATEFSNKIVHTNFPYNFNYKNNPPYNYQDNRKYDGHYPKSLDHNDGKNHDNNYDIGKTRLDQDNVWKDRTQLTNDRNVYRYENSRYKLTENSNRNYWPYGRKRYWNDRPEREWHRNSHNNVQDKPYGNVYDYRNTLISHFQNNHRQQPNRFYDNEGLRRNQNNLESNNPNPFYTSSKPGDTTGQCEQLTSSPPDPRSGCCGREVADDDRITDIYNNATTKNQYWSQQSLHAAQLSMSRDVLTQENGNNATFELEFRISGGKATELYQYPWTVFILTTFNYGTEISVSTCGGSLISAKYVLTAGHCVYDKDAVVNSVEVKLAEYDKRSFPRDCKVSGNEEICIENIVMYAEDIIVHPQYENQRLLNDISLIRLQGKAPYTEYIRPICLPSINIDEPEFSNLQLEVAGWGRNGLDRSNVKQSTVLHLVNKNECKQFYRNITTKHICAAGNKGEDTCKGDSGSPLMMVYRGQYYVAGVVSGKRADSPCGSAVPSLYTNVYHYLDWILSNIRN